MFKNYIKLVFLALASIIYVGCQEDPYDWSDGSVVIEGPYLTTSGKTIQAQSTVKIYDFNRVDSVKMSLVYYRKIGTLYRWVIKETKEATPMDDNSQSHYDKTESDHYYGATFSNLSSNQYRVTLYVWADGLTDPIQTQSSGNAYIN